MKRFLSFVTALAFIVGCSATDTSPLIPASSDSADASARSAMHTDSSSKPALVPYQPPCGTGTVEDGVNGDGSPNCVPDDSGSGSGGSSGTGGGVSGPKPTATPAKVAVVAPQAGMNCNGSPIQLGTDNLPENSNTKGTTVTDIFGMNGPYSTYGWLYLDQNGSEFFQRNPNDTSDIVSSLTTFFQSVPVVAGVVNALINSTTQPYALTTTQMNNIEQSWTKTTGHAIHTCFNAPLTV